MCGIIGINGFDDVAHELAIGMNGLQHRGQDAAGIVTFNGRFHLEKGVGLVNRVFTDHSLDELKGHCGLGHVRYATQGTNDAAQAQPIYMNYPFGLAMVHNGNVINFNELSRRLHEENRVIETSNDLELILYTLASFLEGKNIRALTPEDVFDAVEATQRSVQGAYAALTLLPGHDYMLAFTDPHGIRPLALGKRVTSRGSSYAFASETACLDLLGYQLVRELEAGEAVLIDSDRQVHSKILYRKEPAFCVFEYIYFGREDSTMQGRLIATERMRMGRMLAKTFQEAQIKPDVVIDVPSSAYFFATGLAEDLHTDYRRGLKKNEYIGRSFLFPTQAKRDMAVRLKLSPIRPFIKGKKVAVLDDSIVRGTTSKHLVDLLKEAGADKVYFVSAAPPVRYPCVYGIDISVKSELIAANNAIDDIASYLGVDKVIYQSLDDLKELYRSCGFCYACFSGEFPTGLDPETLKEIEEERLRSKERRSRSSGSDRRRYKGRTGALSEPESTTSSGDSGAACRSSLKDQTGN